MICRFREIISLHAAWGSPYCLPHYFWKNKATDESCWVKYKVLSLWPGLLGAAAECFKLLCLQTKENGVNRRHCKYKDKSHSTKLYNQSGIVRGHHSHAEAHSAVRKAVKCWLFVDTSWADKCQWYTMSDKDIHSCLERGFPDAISLQCSSASLLDRKRLLLCFPIYVARVTNEKQNHPHN